MNLIPYLPEFHAEIATWWDGHQWPVIPQDLLPENGRVAVNDSGEMVFAAWLYKTDSKIAWMEWFISNPKASKQDVSLGKDLVINDLSDLAKELGFTDAFTSMKHEGLIRGMQKHGFAISETGMTNLVRNLWQ